MSGSEGKDAELLGVTSVGKAGEEAGVSRAWMVFKGSWRGEDLQGLCVGNSVTVLGDRPCKKSVGPEGSSPANGGELPQGRLDGKVTLAHSCLFLSSVSSCGLMQQHALSRCRPLTLALLCQTYERPGVMSQRVEEMLSKQAFALKRAPSESGQGTGVHPLFPQLAGQSAGWLGTAPWMKAECGWWE